MDIFDIAIARKFGGGGGSTGGGGDIDALIDGSITEVASNALKVAPFAFYENDTIKTASLPLAETIYENAFYGCSQLTDIYLPKVKALKYQCFFTCTSLTNIDFPSVETLAGYIFQGCTNLISANFPSLIRCTNSQAFYGCTNLTSVNVPNLIDVYSSMFSQCKSLEFIDLPSAFSIKTTAFNTCNNLNTIVLRSKTVCTLANVNAFVGTPFAIGGTGGIAVVPQSLIEQYKIATNWSTLYEGGTCTFIVLEGSEYDV